MSKCKAEKESSERRTLLHFLTKNQGKVKGLLISMVAKQQMLRPKRFQISLIHSFQTRLIHISSIFQTSLIHISSMFQTSLIHSLIAESLITVTLKLDLLSNTYGNFQSF
ncbi:hypothetical protein DPMN_100315 [Dreissena polymorpha]|uniref:Uncharacterized protein n=1 Tax=Dreissena polymorpha TaxID=45954 RepID=A0A9D4LHB2_DREPO|nr:hypothetical protein DPMN_100315 [Dreissena polymorpha]